MTPLGNPTTRFACLLSLLALAAPAALAGSEAVFEKTWRIDGSRLDQGALLDSGAFTVASDYSGAALAVGCSAGASGDFLLRRVVPPGSTAWLMTCVNAVVPTGETGVLADANPRAARAGGALSLHPGTYGWTFQGAGYGDVAIRVVGFT